MIHIGDTPDGKRVEIPVFHTGVFGQTGVGKTRLLKYMMAQAEKEGYTVLIFDSKITGAEFEGVGEDLDFYLEESTDPDVFRSLIEGMRTKGKGNMERFRGGFIEICEPPDAPKAKNFKEIGKRLQDKLSDPHIRGFTRSMYSEVYHDYKKLTELIGEFRFSENIVMDVGGVYRIPTYRLPNLALQGLVVRSVVDRILGSRSFEKLILLVDEAPNFVPQTEFSPAKPSLQRLDSQGRSHKIFGWYSGQTLTGFDKRNMKNLWYWVIGREMENNEARDAWKTQTTKALKVDEIRRLKVREFVAISPEFTERIMVPEVPDRFGTRHELSAKVAENNDKFAMALDDDWSDVGRRVEEVEAKLRA